MSGHKPFRALAERVTATPGGRERVETYRRLFPDQVAPNAVYLRAEVRGRRRGVVGSPDRCGCGRTNSSA
jgi:hypothetical protein